MVFLFRRLIKQMLLVALTGFVVRKAMASSNPRVKRLGHQTNRLLGGAFGLDETGHRVSRRRGVARSAGTAIVGGAVSYFLDPQQGHERRARVKGFAAQRLRRGREPLALPRGTYEMSAAGVERAVPRAASG